MARALIRQLVQTGGGLITSDFQIQLGANAGGLLLGAGTPYDVIELDGWDDLPPYSLTDVNKPNAPGAWAGPMYPQERTITATVQVAGTPGFSGSPSTAQYSANLDALRAITNPGADTTIEWPIVIQQAGRQLMASVRCQQRSMPTTLGYASPGQDKATLQLVATDPRRYALAVQSASCGLYSATGGLAYPITYPLNWGTIISSGTLQIVNAGDTATPPLLTITGGGNTPSITRQDTGQSLLIDLNLQPTDTLVIDTLNEQLLLDGSSVYAALDPSSDALSSFLIAPGTTTLGLSVASGTGTTLTAAWQSAYL